MFMAGVELCDQCPLSRSVENYPCQTKNSQRVIAQLRKPVKCARAIDLANQVLGYVHIQDWI